VAINLNKAFGIHEVALELRAERARLLAANLANADTPNYKARDIDFNRELQQALGQQQAEVSLKRTHQKHLDSQAGRLATRIMYRLPMQPDTGDGNSVDAQIEQAKFAQNALEYQTTLRILNGKIKGLLTAIKGE